MILMNIYGKGNPTKQKKQKFGKPVNELVKTKVDTVKLEVDTVNDTVFDLIKKNNKITATEICVRLKISLSTAKRKIKELKEQEKIERSGSDKTGYWKIIEQ